MRGRVGVFLGVVGICVAILLWLPYGRQDDGGIGGSGRYERIISVSPALTEIIFALGCGDRVAAVGDFVTWPPEATEKQVIGGYINPNLEVILSLQPDLVVIQGRNETLAEFCGQNGIAFERLAADHIADVYAAIEALGVMLAVPEAADSLHDALADGLDKVRRQVAGYSRPTVFYSMGHTPGSMNTLFTTGGNAFVSELITFAGGSNSFGDRPELYPEISKEVLVERAPEIIIESAVGHAHDLAYCERLIRDWAAFPTIPAVRHSRVHLIVDEYLEIPGPRLPMAAELLARMFHPEAYRD